jgi:hypothetical protein
MAQFATVDVDVIDLVALEPLTPLLGSHRQSGYAMALQAAMQRAATGGWSRRQPRTSSSGSSVFCRKARDDGFLSQCQHRALGNLRPHRRIVGRSPTAPFGHRLRVQALAGGKRAGPSCEAWSSARRRGVVRALP